MASLQAIATFAILTRVACQMKILTAPFRSAARRHLRCFHQQDSQQRVALLADVTEPSPVPAGILRRCQPQIARALLAKPKPFPISDD